jgi:hypothetical protein
MLVLFCLSMPRSADVVLDLGSYLQQIDAPEGASVSQFWRPKDGTRGEPCELLAIYNTLEGFPDDSIGTFGAFCDVSFGCGSPKGMGMSQLWTYTCYYQANEPGSLGEHYAVEDFLRQDFSMYEPAVLDKSDYIPFQESFNGTMRGNAVAIYRAALRRAREENKRFCPWVDNICYPEWLWEGNDINDPIPERNWNKAALYSVYYTKYLVARYGIPVHAVNMMNEPWSSDRHKFTGAQGLAFCGTLRAKLDEAGLTGVKCSAGADARDDYGDDQIAILKNDPSKGDDVDIIGIHHFWIENMHDRFEFPSHTRYWLESSIYKGYFSGAASWYSMGADENVDETIRLYAWRFGRGANFCGTWQVGGRLGVHMGHTTIMPPDWDPHATDNDHQIDGAAVVYPYLRPGMFYVQGSMGAHGDDPYSVDAFGGRGHPELIVVTNDGTGRSLSIAVEGCATDSFAVYRCREGVMKHAENGIAVTDGMLTIEAPAHSVTSLVAHVPATEPRVYLIVGDATGLTTFEQELLSELRELGLDAVAVSQHLSEEEKDRFNEKRHPIDAMGAACYVLSPSIDRPDFAYAYRHVMAPVCGLGRDHADRLGVYIGDTVAAGEFLSFRDELDPPIELLDDGKPRACGYRAAGSADAPAGEIIQMVARLVQRGGAMPHWRYEGAPSASLPPPATQRVAPRLSAAGGRCAVDAPSRSTWHLAVYNTAGRRIASIQGRGSSQIDLYALASGTYCLTLSVGATAKPRVERLLIPR